MAATTPLGRRKTIRLTARILIVASLLAPASAYSGVGGNERDEPLSVSVADATTTEITIAWSTSSRRPFDHFDVFLDARGVDSTNEARYTFSNLECDRSYTLGVEGIDPGNQSTGLATVIATPRACPVTSLPIPPADADAPRDVSPAAAPSPPWSESPPAPSPVPASDEAPKTNSPTSEEGQISPPAAPPIAGLASDRLWDGAGAFVWHETGVSPEALGRELRTNGFSWVALLVHDGTTVDPIEEDWVRRIRAASGLAVGGWGVLRAEPELEAELAHRLVRSNRLDFYIANAEAEYKYSGDDGTSADRLGRSTRFVSRFRTLEPDVPSALSSYARTDFADIDWKAWSAGHFAFLPQAYVNDLGTFASPQACVRAAESFFDRSQVHPTVGMYLGVHGKTSAETYVDQLLESGARGFSVYLAESGVTGANDWAQFGRGIRDAGIASLPEEISAAALADANDTKAAGSRIRLS